MTAAPLRKLLLIGWDSADWKYLTPLMEAGQMPALSRLVEGGCMGQISTLHPVYSPMLWTSIATGKRPYQHGVLGFSEPLPDGSGVRPISSLSRRAKAFWNIFHQQGWRGHVVGWWPSHPAEPINGCMISNLCHHAVGPQDQEWPMPPGGVHPKEMMAELADLRAHPNDFTPEMIEPFIPKAREIDQDKDKRLASLMKILGETVTVHSWALHLMEHTEWDYMAVYYDAMDHFSHAFMKYHPPRQEFVSEKDFELYSGVIAQAARFHDMMLARLLSLAPPDTTVILLSDHGFHPDALRPGFIAPIPAGPADEHRDFGIVVLNGPGLKKDELLHGASILDIAPTLLTLQGLPVGEDMDGRPLLAAFEQAPLVKHLPSWDEVPGDDGSHPPDVKTDPASEKAALEQLIALGYVQRPPDSVEEAVRETQRELDINLAEALMDGGKEGEALPILRKLAADYPDEWRFHLRLAMCCKMLGRVEELSEVVERLQARREEVLQACEEVKQWREKIMERAKGRKARRDGEATAPVELEGKAEAKAEPLLNEDERKTVAQLQRLASLNTHGLDFLRAVVALAEKRPADALALLRDAEEGLRGRPGIHLQIGETYQRLAKWDEAAAAFQRALQLDPDNPHAFVGLARCFLAQRQPKDAAGAALNAIHRLHHYPLAHFLLGLAMLRLGLSERAALAWEETLSLNPAFWPAHLRLGRLRKTSAPEKSARHFAQARIIREQAVAIARGKLPPVTRELQIPAHQGDCGLRIADCGLEPESADTVASTQARRSNPQSAIHNPKLVSFPPETLGAPRPPFDSSAVAIVTGLPRSGTSLLMQMLAAGGLETFTDGQRRADEDNPRGYFELEAVKALAQDNSCLKAADGKAVKVVLPLLPHLPPEKKYQVLLIERDLDEIVSSQQAMLDRSRFISHDPETLRPAYERVLKRSRQMLSTAPQIRTLRLSHRWLMENPHSTAEAIANFFGGGLSVEKMQAVVEPALHRQKRQPDRPNGRESALSFH